MKILKTKIVVRLIALYVSSISLISCTKNDEPVIIPEKPINDCVSKNYGVITVNFATVNERHAIDITTIITNVIKSKIVNIGIATDTVHLKPNNYNVSIQKVNANGAALDNGFSFTNRQVTQCSTQVINAPN